MPFPIIPGGSPASTSYQVSRSLRIRGNPTNAYLSRTPGSAGNRQTYTWSGWVKRGLLGSTRYTLFSSSNGGANNFTAFSFDFDNIRMLSYNGGVKVLDRTSTPIYRDPSAWYHIVFAIDMTQATATNRQRVYVNGVEVTAWTNTTTLAQNSDTWVNYNQSHFIAKDNDVTTYFDGYMAEVNFIDGYPTVSGTTYNATTWAALNVASLFGQSNALTGVWEPKQYTGTYGTNGFYLPFSDNTNTTTIGKDFAQPSGSSARSFYNNLSTSGSGWQSYGLRQLVPSSAITLGGLGTKIRLTIRDASGIGLTANSIKIGKRASSGNAWDFDGNQVQVTFSGSNSVTVAANSTAVSDWITFPLVSTSDLILACGFSTTVACGLGRTEGVTNYTSYELINGSANATDTAPTGYTGTAGRVALFQQLEIDGNHWNTNNISLTSGTTYDSMIDSPTNYADGGTGRGNYCVLNPLDKGASASTIPSDGNLTFTLNSAAGQAPQANQCATFSVNSGKWYWEVIFTNATAGGTVGIVSDTYLMTTNAYSSSSGQFYAYGSNGYKYNGSTGTASWGATYGVNDVIGVALDLDSGTISFYKNGALQGGGSAFTGITGLYKPHLFVNSSGSSSVGAINFGQRPFVYSNYGTDRPASTFLALNTQNLPAPALTPSP